MTADIVQFPVRGRKSPAVSPHLLESDGPDAILFELERLYLDAEGQVDNDDMSEAEADAFMARAREWRQDIAECQAHTLAGMAVKLRAAISEDGTMSETDWQTLESLLDDLKRGQS